MLKEVYYYMFYIFYRLAKKSPTIFSYSFVAGLSLLILEILFLFSVMFFIDVIFNLDINTILVGDMPLKIGDRIIGVPALCGLILIFLFNWFSFDYRDRWKGIVESIDKLEKRKKKKYSIISWGIIIGMIFSIIFSIYLLDLKARKNETGPYSKEFNSSQ